MACLLLCMLLAGDCDGHLALSALQCAVTVIVI